MVSAMAAVQVDARDEIRELENMELETSLTEEQYSKLMALHLMSGNVNEAKVLWTRIPDALKTSECLAHLKAVWKCMWDRDHVNTYKAVQSYEWPPSVAPLMKNLILKLKGRLLELVGRAYTSVRLKNVASLWGVDELVALEICSQLQWEYEAESGLVFPKPMSSGQAVAKTNDSHLQQFTGIVSFLEK